MGSSSGYSVQAQMRYIMQWFHEWSEMQRQDFLPILAQKFAPSGYINGLVSGFEGIGGLEDRPPSLFQCRVKLFRDWSENWSTTEKEQLLTQIKSADPAFAEKFEEEILSVSEMGDTKVGLSPQSSSVEALVEDTENVLVSAGEVA